MFDLVVCETDPGPPISNSDFKLYMPGGGESKKEQQMLENDEKYIAQTKKERIFHEKCNKTLTCSFSISSSYFKPITSI